MDFLSILMIGVGLSMDAFAVALAKGMNIKEGIWKKAIKIGIFFGVFQAVMPLIGWWAGTYFEAYIKSFDHWIAFILLSIIGGKMIYESIKERRSDNSSDDEAAITLENDEDLSNKNLTILAIATSIDALAVGVSFAFLNVNIVSAVIIIGITTLILCVIAVILGKQLGKVFQNYAEIIGGIILIGIGLKILIEHLMTD